MMVTDKMVDAACNAAAFSIGLASMRRVLEAAEAAREPIVGFTDEQCDIAMEAYMRHQRNKMPGQWTFRGAMRDALFAAAMWPFCGVKPPNEGTSAIKTEARIPDLWVKVYVDGGKPSRPMMIDDAIAALEALRSEPTVSEAATVTGGSRLKTEQVVVTGPRPSPDSLFRPKRTHKDNVAAVRAVHCDSGSELFVTSLEALGLLPR